MSGDPYESLMFMIALGAVGLLVVGGMIRERMKKGTV